MKHLNFHHLVITVFVLLVSVVFVRTAAGLLVAVALLQIPLLLGFFMERRRSIAALIFNEAVTLFLTILAWFFVRHVA